MTIISAESTIDLTDEMCKELNIQVIPYHIYIDGRNYIDKVNITPKETFAIFERTGSLPQTSAINVAEYLDHFKEIRAKNKRDDIVHFTLGGALSSSARNAELAAKEMKNVYVVDSNSLSIGSGLQAMDAAQMAKEGKSGKEIAEYFQTHSQHYHVSFVINTLEYLKAGGRCSSVAALAAAAFNIKPCIIVDPYKGGSMYVTKKYRGKFKKVISKYVYDKLDEYDDIDYSRCIIACTTPLEGIDQYGIVRKILEEETPFETIYEVPACTTISSHCGPGTIGIAFKTESNCL